MIEKALWYVDHQDTHVHIYEWEGGDYGYYVLRKDSPGGVKKLTKRHIEMYEKRMRGVGTAASWTSSTSSTFASRCTRSSRRT